MMTLLTYHFKEVWRSPSQLGLMLGLPLLFLTLQALNPGRPADALAASGIIDRSRLQAALPGVLLWAMLLLLPLTVARMAKDLYRGFLDRLKATSLGAPDLILGYALAMVLCGPLQIAAILVVSALLGMHTFGNLLLAAGIVVLLGLASVGLSLVLNGLLRHGPWPVGVAWAIAVLLGLISGAWFPVQAFPEPVSTALSYLPTAQALTAVRDALALGQGLGELRGNLLSVGIYTMSLWVVGIPLFYYRVVR